MNQTYCEIQKQTTIAHDTYGEIRKQTTLTAQQLRGSQAAVVTFNMGMGCDINTQPRQPGLTMDIENNGHVIAGRVTDNLTVQVVALPTMKRIGGERRIPIGPQQMLPNTPDAGGNTPIRKEYFLPEFSKETCEAVRRLEKTIRIESMWSYQNGFGVTYTGSECKELLATNFSTGDPAKKTEPYPNFVGPVDCVSFSEKLAEAYRLKRVVDQETKRMTDEYNKQHPAK